MLSRWMCPSSHLAGQMPTPGIMIHTACPARQFNPSPKLHLLLMHSRELTALLASPGGRWAGMAGRKSRCAAVGLHDAGVQQVCEWTKIHAGRAHMCD